MFTLLPSPSIKIKVYFRERITLLILIYESTNDNEPLSSSVFPLYFEKRHF